MEAKFVKGPYLRDGRYVYALVPLLPEDQRKGLMECNTFACCVQGNNGKYAATEEQLEATAALFAAAPKMLEALERLSTQMNNMLFICEIPDRFASSFNAGQEQARAAIAEAYGEEA